MADPAEPRWHWRNCRNVEVSLSFHPLSWAVYAGCFESVYGATHELVVGPFTLRIEADHGNVSSESRFIAALGLSEVETYARALRYEGRADD